MSVASRSDAAQILFAFGTAVGLAVAIAVHKWTGAWWGAAPLAVFYLTALVRIARK